MSETPEHLTERLRSDGERVQAFFRNLTPDQWEREIYSEGSRWNVCQILAHFVVSEQSMTRLVENILDGGSGSPEDFNLDVYNERQVASLSNVAVDGLLNQFSISRGKTADLVDKITERDLTRQGRHPFLGIATLEDIIKLIYRHNQIHLRDIKRVLGSTP
jgi:hypothetical protein